MVIIPHQVIGEAQLFSKPMLITHPFTLLFSFNFDLKQQHAHALVSTDARQSACTTCTRVRQHIHALDIMYNTYTRHNYLGKGNGDISTFYIN